MFQEAYLRQFFPEENSFVLGNHDNDHIFLFTYSPMYSCQPGVFSDECEKLLSSMEQSLQQEGELPKFECTSDVESVGAIVFDSSPNEVEMILDTHVQTTVATEGLNSCDGDLLNRISWDGQCELSAISSCGRDSPVAVDHCTPYEGGLDMCLLNMMMYDMDEEISRQFMNEDGHLAASQVTVCSFMFIGYVFINSLTHS